MMASSSVVILYFFGAAFLLVAALGSELKNTEAKIWGTKDPKNVVCSTGKKQSPIDIVTSKAIVNKSLKPLTRNYHVYNASLATDDYDVQVVFDVQGGLVIDEKTYKLKQMHWHTPSEHRLNGVHYASELHQVHVADDGSRAVVGILLEEGPPFPVLTMLKPQLDELANKSCEGEEVVPIPKFDSSFLRRRPRKYYTYLGSLTTPPCDENVIWIILAKVKTISKDQIAALDAPACAPNKNDARPMQPLNARTIQKYDGN